MPPSFRARSLRLRLAAGALVVGVTLAPALPAAADGSGPVTRNPACEDTRGLRALFKPISTIKCVLGIGEEEVAAAGKPGRSPVAPERSTTAVVEHAAAATPVRYTTYGAAIPLTPPPPITSCDPPRDLPVVSLVAAVFRCRLTEAGLSPDDVRYATAEALVVADCESRLDPNAIVFDGRYLERAHPRTGMRYSAAGVFQFIRRTGDDWIVGGYANATDPVASADAAARLYLFNRRNGIPPWSDWACAAANDGFKASSVLPGWPGGPASLPDWAAQY